MKIIYTFHNNSGIYSAEFNDTSNILWGIVSYRSEDATEWDWILEDIKFIQHNLVTPIIIDGEYYHGKTDRIEQGDMEGYPLWLDSSVCNVLNDTYIYSNRDYSKIIQESMGSKVTCYISTQSFCTIIAKWRNFLLSGETEERGEIEIEFVNV